MDGQPAAVHIVSFLAQEIKELAVDHGNQEIEGAVRIAHDEKQHRFTVSEGVQLQLVVHGDLPQLLDIEGGKASAAGNVDAFRCFSRRELVFLVLPHGEVVRLSGFQLLKG